MAERLLRRPVELGDDPLVVDGDDGIERGFEDGAFSGLGLGQRFFEPGLPVDRAVEEHQARGPPAAVGLQPEELGLDVDRLAGAEVAQAAAALPAAGPVDGRHGHVAEFGPGLFGVEVAQGDGGDRLPVAQPHQPLAGGVEIERLAVRGRQADEIGGRLGQDTSQRVGAGVRQIRPLSHGRHLLSLARRTFDVRFRTGPRRFATAWLSQRRELRQRLLPQLAAGPPRRHLVVDAGQPRLAGLLGPQAAIKQLCPLRLPASCSRSRGRARPPTWPAIPAGPRQLRSPGCNPWACRLQSFLRAERRLRAHQRHPPLVVGWLSRASSIARKSWIVAVTGRKRSLDQPSRRAARRRGAELVDPPGPSHQRATSGTESVPPSWERVGNCRMPGRCADARRPRAQQRPLGSRIAHGNAPFSPSVCRRRPLSVPRDA